MSESEYDSICPHCHAGVMMVNTAWAECVSPYCTYPYSVMGIWARDFQYD